MTPLAWIAVIVFLVCSVALAMVFWWAMEKL